MVGSRCAKVQSTRVTGEVLIIVVRKYSLLLYLGQHNVNAMNPDDGPSWSCTEAILARAPEERHEV